MASHFQSVVPKTNCNHQTKNNPQVHRKEWEKIGLTFTVVWEQAGSVVWINKYYLCHTYSS